MLYWEGNGSAIQGTDNLRIPQFSFLGKTLTSKQVPLYTGMFAPFFVSCLLSLLYPGKLLRTSALDLYTLCLASFRISFRFWNLPKPLSEVPMAYSANKDMGVGALGQV